MTVVEGSLWLPDAMWARGGNSNGRLIARLAQLVKAPFRATVTFLMSVAENPPPIGLLPTGWSRIQYSRYSDILFDKDDRHEQHTRRRDLKIVVR